MKDIFYQNQLRKILTTMKKKIVLIFQNFLKIKIFIKSLNADKSEL